MQKTIVALLIFISRLFSNELVDALKGITPKKEKQAENDNPTIGIILCTDKDNTVVKYSVLNENENLFVSKYQLYLPTEEELRAEIERDVLEIELVQKP